MSAEDLIPKLEAAEAGSREPIARIIDPGAWSEFDYYMANTAPSLPGNVSRERIVNSFWGCRRSLAKADEILAFLKARDASIPTPKGQEAGR